MTEILRAVAPNAGPMTLGGTNSYVILADGAAWIVDPGPKDAGHLHALMRLLDTDMGMVPVHGIVLTHHHADHAHGAGTVQRMIARAQSWAPPLFTADPTRVPGSVPLPGELELDGAAVATIVLTPGHTADSACLVTDDGALLAGDTILGSGATTSLAIEDGDLRAYLGSLALLRQMVASGMIARILPGHGDLVDADPGALLDDLIRHRLDRVDEVRAARRNGALTMRLLLRSVYGDALPDDLVEPAIWNLQATLDYIREEDRVGFDRP